MPYELTFSKAVTPDVETDYMNECCYGGDVVGAQLLPRIKERYGDVEFNQEDWGWFLWFSDARVGLAVDIFCDDPKEGKDRIMLTSRQKRYLLPDKAVDTRELEELKTLVVPVLENWAGKPCQVEVA